MHKFHDRAAADGSNRLHDRPQAEQIEIKTRDKSVKVPKVYEFQFYSDFDACKSLCKQIQTLIDSFERVPEELKSRLAQHL